MRAFAYVSRRVVTEFDLPADCALVRLSSGEWRAYFRPGLTLERENEALRVAAQRLNLPELGRAWSSSMASLASR
jgi:hypothetical protein